MSPQRGKAWKREAAVSALLSEPTIGAAAAKVGICERTLLRWLQDAAFREAYHAAQKRLVEAAIDVLRRAGVTFANTVRLVSEDASVPGAATRYAAAARGLEILLKATGNQDFERQLAEIEEAVTQLRLTSNR